MNKEVDGLFLSEEVSSNQVDSFDYLFTNWVGKNESRKIGYRTDHSKWAPIDVIKKFETDLGNAWFDDSGKNNWEVIWVTHSKKDAKKYGDDIREIELSGAELLMSDGDGGHLYGRPAKMRESVKKVDSGEGRDGRPLVPLTLGPMAEGTEFASSIGSSAELEDICQQKQSSFSRSSKATNRKASDGLVAEDTSELSKILKTLYLDTEDLASFEAAIKKYPIGEAKEPFKYFFGKEGYSKVQSSSLGSDPDNLKIGVHRSGHAYTFLPHRIKFYIERFGVPDFIHVVLSKSGPGLKAVYAEKGKDMIQLWSYVDTRMEPGWKAFEKQAHDAGYRIKSFTKGSVEDGHGYWLESADTVSHVQSIDTVRGSDGSRIKSKSGMKYAIKEGTWVSRQNQFLRSLRETRRMQSSVLVFESTSELSKALEILYLSQEEEQKLLQSLAQYPMEESLRARHLAWLNSPLLTSKVEWLFGSRTPNDDGSFSVNVRLKLQPRYDNNPVRVIFEMIYWPNQPTGFLFFIEIGPRDKVLKKYNKLPESSFSGGFALIESGKKKQLSDLPKRKRELLKKWQKLVNMGPAAIKKYLDSEDGKSSGLSKKEASKLKIKRGRDSARAIIRMKKKGWKNWTLSDWRWAGRQVSFISRMKGNKGPLIKDGNKTEKLKSLLIWGHRPESRDRVVNLAESKNKKIKGIADWLSALSGADLKESEKKSLSKVEKQLQKSSAKKTKEIGDVFKWVSEQENPDDPIVRQQTIDRIEDLLLEPAESQDKGREGLWKMCKEIIGASDAQIMGKYKPTKHMFQSQYGIEFKVEIGGKPFVMKCSSSGSEKVVSLNLYSMGDEFIDSICTLDTGGFFGKNNFVHVAKKRLIRYLQTGSSDA